MFYSQKSYPQKLGTCNTTIRENGCYLTSIANLAGEDPLVLNELFIKKGVYANGCDIVGSKAASVLGMTYEKTITPPEVVCICETDHYKKVGVPQHFFLYDPNKFMRVDPLDLKPDWELNTYKIISYRIFMCKKCEELKLENMELNADLQACEGIVPKLTETIENQKEVINVLTEKNAALKKKVEEYEGEQSISTLAGLIISKLWKK
jgi:hypothetical protein